MNQKIMFLFVLASAFTVLIGAIRNRKTVGKGWMNTSVFLIAASISFHFLLPEYSGTFSAVIFGLFFVAPALLMHSANRAVYANRFKTARRLLKTIRTLHPFFSIQTHDKIFSGFEAVHNGDPEKGVRLLETFLLHHPEQEKHIRPFLFRINHQWLQLKEWTEEQYPLIFSNPSTVPAGDAVYYLRSLLEIGNTPLALHFYREFSLSLNRDPHLSAVARMMIFAFNGSVDAVRYMFTNSAAAKLSENNQTIWIALATECSGEPGKAREIYQNLLGENDGIIRSDALFRLENPRPKQTFAVDTSMLEKMKKTVAQEHRYSFADHSNKHASLCISLLTANLVMMILQIFSGGSEDTHTLYRMGALMIAPGLDPEPVRYVLSMFLHFGTAHFAVNVLVLFVLGKFMERFLGKLRFLLVYFAGGIGANIFFVFAVKMSMIDDHVLAVGASGAIMSLLGAEGAIMLKGKLLDKAPVAARQFKRFIFIVSAQTFTDTIIPETSLIHHLSGLAIGFIITMLFPFKTLPRKS